MATSKSVYLNEDTINIIERIKTFFDKFNLHPTDSGVILAALEVYEKTLNNMDFGKTLGVNEKQIKSMIDERVKELMKPVET